MDYLSKEKSTALKGIFAIFVLIHHLYQYSGLFRQTSLGTLLQAMGTFSVAVFFFLSGYGLMASYKRDGRKYINEFVYKRILSFYCILLFVAVLYFILSLCLGESFGWRIIWKTFTGEIIVNGWYLQAQLVFYILFWLVFLALKKQSNAQKLIIMLIVQVAYMILVYPFLGATWVQSALVFVLGMIWCEYKEKIVRLFNTAKKWIITSGIVFSLFCIFFLIDFYISMTVISLFARIISIICFVIFVNLLIVKIPITNIVTKFLGEISLEIYVFQGVFLLLFRSDLIFIQNPYLYVVVVIAGTMGFALLMHPVIKRIFKIFKDKKHRVKKEKL